MAKRHKIIRILKANNRKLSIQNGYIATFISSMYYIEADCPQYQKTTNIARVQNNTVYPAKLP